MDSRVEDQISAIYENNFMDSFHDYQSVISLWRYQHRMRVSFIEEAIEEYAKPNCVAMDAGAGKGPNTFLLARKMEKVYAFEYCETELERLRANLISFESETIAEIKLKQADLQHIPLPDGSVNFVVCSEVLEHIPDYNKAMRELYRVSSRNAYLVFSMPNRSSLFWQYDKLLYRLRRIYRKLRGRKMPSSGYAYWEHSRHWAFCSSDIRNIAKSAGFSIVKEQGVAPVIFNEALLKFACKFGLLRYLNRIERFLGRVFPRLSPIYFLILRK